MNGTTITTQAKPEYVTVGELAHRYRLSASAVYEGVYSGRLPGVVRFGRAVRVRLADVERQVESTGQILLPAAR